MESVPHPTLPSRVLVGYRVAGAGPLGAPHGAQRVLTGIVKGTYAAGGASAGGASAGGGASAAAGASASLAPVQLPIFEQDVFFDLVRNGDFRAGAQVDPDGTVITPVAAWTSADPATTISHHSATSVMRVQGVGPVTQVVALAGPAGGRPFTLRVRARVTGGAGASVGGIYLEAESGQRLLTGTAELTPAFTEFQRTGSWPPALADERALLALSGAAGATVEYQWVRLHEGSSSLAPDARDPIRYEHDLAAYKPHADVVILGRPAPPEPGPLGGVWEERVTIGGATMRAVFDASGALTHFQGASMASKVPWSSTTPVTFGWQNRAANGGDDGTREGYAGDDLNTFDPDTMALPEAFDNRFCNGGLYAGGRPVFEHLQADAIELCASAEYDDGAGGSETRSGPPTALQVPPAPQMRLTIRATDDPDALTSTLSVPLRLDTLVFDKASERYYAVWRGVWTGLEAVGLGRIVRVAFS